MKDSYVLLVDYAIADMSVYVLWDYITKEIFKTVPINIPL